MLTSLVVLSLSGPVLAQGPPNTEADPSAAPSPFPNVTFGVVSFLQYSAEPHESNGFNAFDVTRGYINIQAWTAA